MNKPKNPISLIQDFLDKDETHEHLTRVHDLVLSLYQKQNPKGAVKAGHAGSVTRWGTAWSGAHLRPMYRTVHRQVPRPMVLRAIRWVNPKRMFPIMNLTKEDMEKMSQEEFEKAFVELANYRKEAHVINNRYNQMLRMIDAGQLPYYIPYANITSQRYADLDKYRERAQRLGLGAADWGNEIDVQAEMFRKAFTDKHDPIDVIDKLWEDGKGEPAPPPFMRVHRRFKEDDRLLRAQRLWVDRFKFTDSNGNEIIASGEHVREAADKAFEIYIRTVEGGEREDFSDSAWKEAKSKWIKGAGKPEKLKRTKLRKAQVWARQFIAVPEGEIRESESVRMPAKGGAEGAAAFLLRVPAGQSWMDDKQWKDLKRGKGPVTIGPKEALVEIHWSEVENDDIDIRREQRWTQEDRIGGRKARHRGARSHQPGHRTEPPLPPIVARRPPAPPAPPAAPGAAPGAASAPSPGDGKPNTAAQKANDAVVQGIRDIVGEDIDIFIDPKLPPKNFGKDYFAKENIKNIQNLGDLNIDGGIHDQAYRRASFVVTMQDGSQWMYKIASGEQFGESLHVGLDRALGLNVSPVTRIENIGIEALGEHGVDFTVDHVVAQGEVGGGHMMEWLSEDDGWVKSSKAGGIDWKYFDTKEKRGTLWGTTLLDMLTGNFDRHGGNFMVNPKYGIAPIDSGFAGLFSEDTSAERISGNVRQIDAQPKMASFSGLKIAVRDGLITEDELRKEIKEYYLTHMDSQKLENVAKVCQAKIDGNVKEYDLDSAAEKFVTACIQLAGVFPDPSKRLHT